MNGYSYIKKAVITGTISGGGISSPGLYSIRPYSGPDASFKIGRSYDRQPLTALRFHFLSVEPVRFENSMAGFFNHAKHSSIEKGCDHV